jgi:hypothetical protein
MKFSDGEFLTFQPYNAENGEKEQGDKNNPRWKWFPAGNN